MPEKIDLNAPAFGVGAQKIEEAPKEAVAEVVAEPKEEIKETPVEESKVPYSRFKKFHDEALQLREEAAEWKAKAEAIRPNVPQVDPQDEAYKLWIENFGDSEASKKAFANQQRIDQIRWERDAEKTREQALEAVRNERYEEAERTEKNVETLDENFEDLSALVGRDLTDKEQSAILDIVDDYTPKDKDGNYAGQILPFEKAWEIYNLKEQASKAPQVQARNNVAGLSGSQSQGDTNISEKDKNFNPLRWDAYKDRL